jgi:hypothetical protein
MPFSLIRETRSPCSPDPTADCPDERRWHVRGYWRKEKELRQFGEYRTRRLVLEAWEQLERH